MATFPSHMGLLARVETGMTPIKREIRQGWAKLGPISVICMMALWGLAMIVPAALPH